MIVITLNKPEFEYDIHSLFKAFFAKENVSATAEQKNYEELVSIHMQVSYSEKEISFCWKQ